MYTPYRPSSGTYVLRTYISHPHYFQCNTLHRACLAQPAVRTFTDIRNVRVHIHIPLPSPHHFSRVGTCVRTYIYYIPIYLPLAKDPSATRYLHTHIPTSSPRQFRYLRTCTYIYSARNGRTYIPPDQRTDAPTDTRSCVRTYPPPPSGVLIVGLFPPRTGGTSIDSAAGLGFSLAIGVLSSSSRYCTTFLSLKVAGSRWDVMLRDRGKPRSLDVLRPAAPRLTFTSLRDTVLSTPTCCVHMSELPKPTR